jgi:hypothetical protein
MADLIETPGVKDVIVPTNIVPMTPEEAAKGFDTVTMIFDVPVKLTLQTNEIVFFTKGIHEVPRHYSDHWYLKAHGVRIHARSVAQAPDLATRVPEIAEPTVTGLESLSREDLLVMAKGYGLTVHPATGVAKLIEKINAAKAGTPEQEGSKDSGATQDGANGTGNQA